MTEKYVLKLYVTGMTPKTDRHIASLQQICEKELDEYDLEIVDILKQPQLAEGDRILATPTLIKQLPEPVRRVIGNLSDTEKVLVGLDLISRG